MTALEPVRYAPDRTFPPYAYLPGRDAHPTRDPAGHMYGLPEPEVTAPAPDDYHACSDYLFGVDLYNHGFHWEAHEVWEGLWHASKDPLQREMFQALIQAAAAGVQFRLGNPHGQARLAWRAAERLRRVEREFGLDYMGIHVSQLATDLARFAFEERDLPTLFVRMPRA